MTRRRIRSPATVPTNLRLGPYTLSAIVAVVTLLAAAVSGGRVSPEVFLVGAGLSLISVGVWHERVSPVLGGATALATATLITAAAAPFEWGIIRPLPLNVHVVDADTGDPIGGAALAAVNHENEMVADRVHTNTAGFGTLIVPIQMKPQGTLYEMYRRPRFEIVDLGWQVEVIADGYASGFESLSDTLPNVVHSVDPEFPELTIALQR
jgi:hypothetical protein